MTRPADRPTTLLPGHGQNRDNRENEDSEVEACQAEAGSNDTTEETHARTAGRSTDEVRENHFQLLPSVST
ncbi:MAG TPA: hypothetical protein VE596_13050 [Gaiellaceae bacterium]|nr:hypothetical protein [Gaiellaceae bacterium]